MKARVDWKSGLAAAAVAASIASSASGGGAVVERLRYVGTGSYGRVIADLSGPARVEMQRIPGENGTGERVVLDLRGVRIGEGARGGLEVGAALLKRVRTGQFSADVARIVLDLESAAGVHVATLPDPDRVVIDLQSAVVGAPDGPVRRLESTAGATRRAPPPGPSRPAPVLEASPGTARPIKIVLDPGHGGKDPGAQGLHGVVEKKVVLEISKMVADRLRKEAGVEVVLTRSDDRYLSLGERTELANGHEADLFVSIHANASVRASLKGLEVYYLNNTNNRGTLRLAAMENGLPWRPNDRRIQNQISDLDFILSDLRQTYKVEESRELATRIATSMERQLSKRWDQVVNLGVKEGPFYVLVGAYMPCVLVEVSFITNPLEAKRMSSDRYKNDIADGIAEGLRQYVRETQLAQSNL